MVRIVKKAEDRKEELIEIALKLFMEKGYVHTSIKDIYTQVNGSFGMFYHHFSSKEDIFATAMGRYTDRFIAGIAEILLDTTLPYAERYQRVLVHWAGLIHGRDKVRETEYDEELFSLLSGKMLSGAVPPVKAYLDEGVANGVIQVEEPCAAAAFIVYGIFGAITEERNKTGNNKHLPQVFASITRLVAKLLGTSELAFFHEDI